METFPNNTVENPMIDASVSTEVEPSHRVILRNMMESVLRDAYGQEMLSRSGDDIGNISNGESDTMRDAVERRTAQSMSDIFSSNEFSLWMDQNAAAINDSNTAGLVARAIVEKYLNPPVQAEIPAAA